MRHSVTANCFAPNYWLLLITGPGPRAHHLAPIINIYCASLLIDLVFVTVPNLQSHFPSAAGSAGAARNCKQNHYPVAKHQIFNKKKRIKKETVNDRLVRNRHGMPTPTEVANRMKRNVGFGKSRAQILIHVHHHGFLQTAVPDSTRTTGDLSSSTFLLCRAPFSYHLPGYPSKAV